MANLATKVLLEADLSKSAVSDTLDMTQLAKASAQAIWTGAAVGMWCIEGSLDGTVWDPLPGFSLPTANGPGHFLVNLETAVPYVRFRFCRSSGAGTARVLVAGEGV